MRLELKVINGPESRPDLYYTCSNKPESHFNMECRTWKTASLLNPSVLVQAPHSLRQAAAYFRSMPTLLKVLPAQAVKPATVCFMVMCLRMSLIYILCF